MKSILMATDLSARSDRALERAVQVAADHGSRLTVVHVVDEDLPAVLADAQETAARQVIQEHLGTISSDNDPQISIEVVFGRAYADILEISAKALTDVGSQHLDRDRPNLPVVILDFGLVHLSDRGCRDRR